MSGTVGDNIFRASGVIAAAAAGIDWKTGDIKTATFTATAGEGYFCNTTAGVFTVNLPAGSAGDLVAISDYAGTFTSNNLTISPNGSEKINSGEGDVILETEGQSLTLVYIDSTQGWRAIEAGSFSSVGGAQFVVATGGTITTTCTNYKVHTFTGPGTFCVSAAGNCGGSDSVDYLVIAGGGGGGNKRSGAGGAGGYRESPGAASGCYTVSPLGVSPAAAIPVSVQGYEIVVGAGGTGGISGPGGSSCVATGGTSGANSSGFCITSTGGGTGGGIQPAAGCCGTGKPGGSGGGGFAGNPGTCDPHPASIQGGTGNTPPTDPDQGFAGGTALIAPVPPGGGGGGGGALAIGGSATPPGQAGPGGAGATSSIDGTPTARAGGGGGGGRCAATPGVGGPGGGGAGGVHPPQGVNGTVNTGGGGGGMGDCADDNSGNGGDGVVIIRYKFQ